MNKIIKTFESCFIVFSIFLKALNKIYKFLLLKQAKLGSVKFKAKREAASFGFTKALGISHII